MKSGQRWQQRIGGEGTGSLFLEHPLTSVRGHEQVHGRGPGLGAPADSASLWVCGQVAPAPQNSEGQKKDSIMRQKWAFHV